MVAFAKDMSILEALEAHPRSRRVFEHYGMACCLCIGANLETIEAGAIMHDVDPDLIVEELNRLGDAGS
jgi:hybrid cluster-associated redox disulfide protein